MTLRRTGIACSRKVTGFKPPVIEFCLQASRVAVAQLQVQHRNAELTLQRAQILLTRGAGQQANVDTALASERALADQIAGAEAQLRLSEINLGYTEIRAPIDGKISRTVITEGNFVSPASGNPRDSC